MRGGSLLLPLAAALPACGRVGFDAVEELAPASCPPSYVAIAGGTMYRLEQAEVTWIAAELACEAEGTHLAVPDSAAESSALAAAFLTGSQRAFIGISDRIVEDHFVPVTGGALSVSLFASGQPDGGSDADGVTLRASGLWGDENDADEHASLCECDGKPADPAAF